MNSILYKILSAFVGVNLAGIGGWVCSGMYRFATKPAGHNQIPRNGSSNSPAFQRWRHSFKHRKRQPLVFINSARWGKWGKWGNRGNGGKKCPQSPISPQSPLSPLTSK